MIAVIPCHSFELKNKYYVLIDTENKLATCTCRFWSKYGKQHNEPCKHMELVIASVKIMPKLLNRYAIVKKPK